MRALKKQNGYTIVETLIVLAVTGTMFVVTVVLVSGQISRYQFRDGVLGSQQSIQSVLNDVQTGYFGLANSTTAACNSGSNSEPGDSNCVYIGKSISISNAGVLTAKPIIAPITSGSPVGQPVSSLTVLNQPETTNLSGNIEYSNSPLTPGDFSVLYTNYPDGSVANFNGGGQAVALFGQDPSGDVTEFNTATGKIICLENGNRKAALYIGPNRSLDVTINYQPTAAECP